MKAFNETDTRAKLIDPVLFKNGWTEDNISREQIVAPTKWNNNKSLFADYVLEHRGTRLAVIEAKANYKSARDGVAQAKYYADRLRIRFAFATNGREIYMMDLLTGDAGMVERYPTPDELWNKMFSQENEWRDRFNACTWGRINGKHFPRYYQKNAANAVLDAIAQKKNRLLLTLATGTGKTGIAFSIAWKLYQTRWNIDWDGKRRPRILFLADRTTLADQAKKDFSAFGEDPMSRLSPQILRNDGKEKPLNANIFFSIFQTFSIQQGNNSEDESIESSPFFGTLPPDFFDMIIIDECHRGGAKDESSWRSILDYFSPAVQLGLTATPKRKDNVDTYAYFGEPLYQYTLKNGIEDGHLTPFRVVQYQTNLDEYIYNPQDQVVSGEIDKHRVYQANDWNSQIHSDDRERLLVRLLVNNLPLYQQTIVFCRTQAHAALVRDLINEEIKPSALDYCVRVTADEPLGDIYLLNFQDGDKATPVILTTSQKLTTGVDAKNVRHIVLFRAVANMIEFKQIIGRGTRLYEGKDYFTIHDFYKNYHLFADPEWDGDPETPVITNSTQSLSNSEDQNAPQDNEKERDLKNFLHIRLSDSSKSEFQSMQSTKFYSLSGEIISSEEFIKNLNIIVPECITKEQTLKDIWANPETRSKLLDRLAEKGASLDNLIAVQKIISAEDTDVFDILEYFATQKIPKPKKERVELARTNLLSNLSKEQQEFIDMILDSYIDKGFEAFTKKNVQELIQIKYINFGNGLSHLKTDINGINIMLTKIQNEIYR